MIWGMQAFSESQSGRSGRGRRSAPGSRGSGTRWAILTAIGVVLLAALFVSASLYTDEPQFCGWCHEMKPYHAAWAAGAHRNVWCVDCHVSRDLPPRFAHKFAALQEVAAHFSGDTTFPRAKVPVVPNSNCQSCHASVTVKNLKGFDHALHASKGSCQACHPATGHTVTAEALRAVGAFNPSVRQPVFSTGIASVGHGVANVPGHVKVACTRCHNLAQTGCSTCHKPKHKARGACQICHQAGPKWTFSHPQNLPQCQKCHPTPDKHFKPVARTLTPCTDCHRQKPGSTWAFTHMGSSADCQSCHARPAKHSAGQCSQCHHKQGDSWAFAHPSTPAPHGIGGKPCKSCHPTTFTDYSCTCHGGGHSGGD
jgi:hypothetical protein